MLTNQAVRAMDRDVLIDLIGNAVPYEKLMKLSRHQLRMKLAEVTVVAEVKYEFHSSTSAETTKRFKGKVWLELVDVARDLKQDESVTVEVNAHHTTFPHGKRRFHYLRIKRNQHGQEVSRPILGL